MIKDRIELFLSIIIICLITVLSIMVFELKLMSKDVYKLRQQNIELIKKE